MNRLIFDQLVAWGTPERAANLLVESFEIVVILLAATLSYYLAKRVLIRIIHKVTAKTRSDWDDMLVEHRGL